ncbi:MAG: FxsA family protein [Nitrospinaceae bacterium]|nr:FxsA family protein [Nitrospinaceae bacterium]MBT3434070.1 FxsA family protein [Nitrospinaceae bacterium]MBT4095139.1 FxsA family protein [Nitrospinaceae bacterium]MBT4429435.1 FxsA family protein [Nitrospinaceae bacterium]MBT5367698.1 FxsA family protein [Nitrospinaceae bacterium]
MIFKLFLLFTAVPLLELMILIELGSALGLSTTVGIVLLTGAIGAWAARTQGFYVLKKIQEETSAGRLPADQLVDGAMVLVGGVFLITPGLLTDCTGFALMVPAVRGILRGILMRKFEAKMKDGSLRIHHG